MARPPVRVASIALATLLLLGAGAARAFNPQPEPPGFGMFGVTQIQRAHLHVALPAVQKTPGQLPPGPCRVEVSFVDEAGKEVQPPTVHTLWPGQAGNEIFTPTRTVPNPELRAAAPTIDDFRHQLRAIVNPLDSTLPPGPCRGLLATVQVDNQQGGAPTLTLSPRDAASGQASGKRHHGAIHFFGPIAIGSGHTARLNAVHVGADGVCQLDWAFVDEAGARTEGTAILRPGQAIHADFVHADATRGVALIRAEATASGKSCEGDGAIGTLEGFDSALGHSHTIVPAQLIVPAVQ